MYEYKVIKYLAREEEENQGSLRVYGLHQQFLLAG
jgi:hypothetical protein